MNNTILLPPARRVRADHPIRRIDGSAKGHLVIDDDNRSWVVKALNSVQGISPRLKSTFNEYLGTRIVELAGIPVAECAIVEVDNDFINWYPHLQEPDYGGFTAGFHYGCKFYDRSPTLSDVMRLNQGNIIQEKCVNKSDATGSMVFDSETSNYDRAAFLVDGYVSENAKNILFTPEEERSDQYKFRLIDQGNCFSANWDFADPPNPPYTIGHWPRQVLGTFSLISKLEWYSEKDAINYAQRFKNITLTNLRDIVKEMPQTWLTFTNSTEIETLLACLLDRFADFDEVFRAQITPTLELAKAYNGR